MREIELTQGYKAFVDDEDYERVVYPKWQVKLNQSSFTQYAVRRRWDKNLKIYVPERLHRVVLDITDTNVHVDHIDMNGLNNCKSNLRIATYTNNAANVRKKRLGSSVYKGVRWHKVDHKWEANIVCNGKQKYLGQFVTEIQAAQAYDKAALELFGEFARINGV